MSQYLKVRAELAKQREQDRRSRLPPRKPPPADFKAELARIRAEIAEKQK